MSEKKNVAESFKQLEGKTIRKVHVHGVNAVSIETKQGEFFTVETVCVLPTLGVYGMEVAQVSREDALGKEAVVEKDEPEMIVRAEGGLAERKVPVNAIEIPDLWRVAQSLKRADSTIAEQVLECWHLCHDLLKHIKKG